MLRKWLEKCRAVREQLERGKVLYEAKCPACGHCANRHGYSSGVCITVDTVETTYVDNDGLKRIHSRRIPCRCKLTVKEVILNVGGEYEDYLAYDRLCSIRTTTKR